METWSKMNNLKVDFRAIYYVSEPLINSSDAKGSKAYEFRNITANYYFSKR